MKRIMSAILCMICILGLCACGAAVSSWQKQYDLGIKYLNEGDYEQAILSFTAASEIDPKNADAYAALADTYLVMGEYDKVAEVWNMIPAEDAADLPEQFSIHKQKTQEISEALQNGESGIWILNCVYDKAHFVAGRETDFRVTALYNLAAAQEGELYLSANVEEARKYKEISESLAAKTGVGACSLSGKAVPTQWGRYFGLRVNLIDSSDSEDGRYTDTIYLTPEGELTDAYAPLNAYGGIEFIYRNGYQPFEEFSDADQQFIADFASAVLAGDDEAAKNLLGYEMDDSSQYTIWNDYKIKIGSGGGATDDGDRSVSANIEMRPENGMGYIYHVECIDAVASLQEDSWSDAVFITRIACSCSNWQWNGTMNLTDDWYHYHTWRDGGTCNLTERTIETGEIVYGLREGTFSAEKNRVEQWSKYPDLNEEEREAAITSYHDGVVLSSEGDRSTWRLMSGDVGQLVDITSFVKGTLDDQRVRDRIFW